MWHFDTQISIQEVSPFQFDPYVDQDGIPIEQADNCYQPFAPIKMNEFHEFLNGPQMKIPERKKVQFGTEQTENIKHVKVKRIQSRKSMNPPDHVIKQLTKLVKQLQIKIPPENMRVITDPMPVAPVNDKPTIPVGIQADITTPKWSSEEIETQLSQEAKNQRELLLWHTRLGHISMRRIQKMAALGCIPTNVARCQIPMCQACAYGTMHKRPWRTSAGVQPIMYEATKPGMCVSVDQLESPLGGLIGQLKGIPTKARFCVATIFVDHYSDLSYVHLQQTTNAEETLEAKHQFEVYATSHGVTVSHYHADNGRFAEHTWIEDAERQKQRMSYSGVGAHHQNGRAEKRIRDLQDLARCSLLDANKKWAYAIDATLWPYALRKANESMNITPHPSKIKSSLELFSGVPILPNPNDEHPFGCPMYVLDSTLQSGSKKAKKWDSRARVAIYLGPSLYHSRSVGLALSLTTGLVSPQFHAKYDDQFATIQNNIVESQWQAKCGFEQRTPTEMWRLNATGMEPVEKASLGMIPMSLPIQHGEPAAETDMHDEQIHPSEGDDQQAVVETPHNSVPVITTRSGRSVHPPSRYQEYLAYMGLEKQYQVFIENDGKEHEDHFDNEKHDDRINNEVHDDKTPHPYGLETCSQAAYEKWEHAEAYASSTDPDILYLHEAMKEPDKQKFVEAMVKEITSQSQNGNWILILRSEVPSGEKVLPSVWAMRRKRKISTGEIYKWKARLNLDGGKQTKGLNYWETYAPVATWSSIRLILNMAARLGWQTRQLDFVQAYPQAPIETDLYMEIPKGFLVNGDRTTYVLKLVKNIYGQKQAGRVWNKFLLEGLTKKLGFTQSKYDDCVLWRGNNIMAIYTDDTIFTGPDPKELDKIIREIGKVFDITSELEVTDFLGVKVERDEQNGTYTLTQPHLIKSILDDLGLVEGSNPRSVPAMPSKILQQYPDSPTHNASWHYRGVIGKLNFLEKSSRPDIAYAVHQAARFSHDPREEHTKAVKLIGRYLKVTMDKGIICKPNGSGVTCYADADFSGNWDPDYAEFETATARSRSGYVIFHDGCPIIWASRLQTEIALSSTEAEYVSLSQSLREVLPMMGLLNELHTANFPVNNGTPVVTCKVFEDNAGALEMARTPKMRPRTKHMNIKYHHFREAVANKQVTLHSVASEDQVADILTKPLSYEAFVKLRYEMLGW